MFNGEIVFVIADVNCIVVDFGPEMVPTKIVNKGDVVALGRKAPRNRWIYEIRYNGEEEYLQGLDKMASQLCQKKNILMN